MGKESNYLDCNVVEKWHNFQNFAEWSINQIGYDKSGWELDKDILLKGNREYGPETCCFVPPQINCMFTLKRGFRGQYCIGVSKNKWGKFRASCSGGMGEGQWHGLSRDTEEEAFLDYKLHKEAIIKKVADSFKDEIDLRVYEALYKYQIEITD